MLFREIYGCYYSAVAEILRYAVRGELDHERIKAIVSEKAFGESHMKIPEALKSEAWQLVTPALHTPLKKEPSLPLTTLQKSWLKAISLDRRIQLFDMDFGDLDGAVPMFLPEMLCYYDQYEDGDDYTDAGYILRFRTILAAVKSKTPLSLHLSDRHGHISSARVMPEYLEYSEKDDKFRLITSGNRRFPTVKLASVVACAPYVGEWTATEPPKPPKRVCVTMTLFDGRNTLERAMLHFSHFEKQVEKLGDTHYTVRLFYDPSDATELLIRILSFGPFVRVEEPASFVALVKERLLRQKRYGVL